MKENEMNADSDKASDVWGSGDFIAIAAVRYCLGRRSYVVNDCADWLIAQWPNIKPSACAVIQQDIENAISCDDAARQVGNVNKPLGWDCDRDRWEDVRKLWAENKT